MFPLNEVAQNYSIGTRYAEAFAMRGSGALSVAQALLPVRFSLRRGLKTLASTTGRTSCSQALQDPVALTIAKAFTFYP
jgi:hypothetical protein